MHSKRERTGRDDGDALIINGSREQALREIMEGRARDEWRRSEPLVSDLVGGMRRCA